MSGSAHRLAWLDHVRAVGIVLIVVGHAIRSAERSGFDLAPAYEAADRAIYSFHMPLFFLLAGMTHALGGRRPLRQALVATGWTIVLPYLLWSSIWIGLKHGFASEANLPVEGSWISILWQPVDHFWFLYVLLLVRLVWLAVDAVDSPLLRRAAIVLPLVVAFVGIGPSTGIFNPVLFFWAAFYGVGVLAIGGAAGFGRPAAAGAGLLAGLFWAGLVGFAPGLMADGIGAARTLAGLAGSFAVIGLMMALAPGGWSGRLLGFVGEASLTIFLTHTLVGAAVRVVLNRLGLLTPADLVVAATVAGVVGPALLHAAVLRAGLVLDRPIGRWVGFGTQRRSHYLDLAPQRAAAPAVSLGGPRA